jgi:micrococcal nuclease
MKWHQAEGVPLFFSLAIGVLIVFAGVIIRYHETQQAQADSVLTVDKSTNNNGVEVYPCQVLKIVDGDTYDVQFNVWSDLILQKRIRHWSVDTWEVRGEEKEKGLKAKEYVIQILKDADIIYLKTKQEEGKYGRTLGTLFVKNGNDINDIAQLLKANGHVKE